MKVTQKQFEQFKAAFLKWQRIFGLTEYRVYFVHEFTKGNFADICVAESTVTARLTTKLDPRDAKLFDPGKCGRHEALHLLTWKLYWLGAQRHTNPSQHEEEWEAVTRRLENGLDEIEAADGRK